MWIVAGVLLGSVLLTSLIGLHTGPHAHALSSALGALAAVWLLIMVAEGRASSALWTLLSADVVLAGGAAVIAWKGLTLSARAGTSVRGHLSITGKEGIAVGDLTPQGIVRVGGENWSATSLNGNVAAGDRVQVISSSGVRLEVWAERPSEEIFGPSEAPQYEKGDQS
jgi:membrane protein implicated in regulation of membrane protease activity